jgi:radical SAM protein with 4Fe4S-binding SPASM domain
MAPFANTQINRLNHRELDALADVLLDQGIRGWQVQLTGPMGRAADEPDWLLQPYDMLELMPRLAAIAIRARERGCLVEAANNLGYYGPYESTLRRSHWQSCQAGKFVLGIEADGAIKGCPSLPTGPYAGGNVRDRTIREIWDGAEQLRFARERTTDELWGFCKGCYYAEECRGGCSWTSHTLLGRRGNMPYCHHRALELEQQGKRERLVKVEDAPGTPFDFGRFEIVLEDLPVTPSNGEHPT